MTRISVTVVGVRGSVDGDTDPGHLLSWAAAGRRGAVGLIVAA